MSEVFGATLSLKDNVSGVLQQAKDSSKGFRGEVEKAKKELQKLDQQKVKEKEIRIKNSAAYKAIEGVKKKLEPISKKAVEIKAKTEVALGKISKVKKALGAVKDKTINVAVKGAAAVGKTLGKAAIAGTAAAFMTLAAAGTMAITSAVDFESQMQNVGTLLDGDVKSKLQGMGSDLKKVSIDTGVSTADLTGGLYQVVSAFGESADSVKQLEIAAKAAKAGNATTTDSVNLLSAVTKGYGDTSVEAMEKASDLAFMTVKLGQTSFPELAASMGQVVPLASTLKVSQEELFGAMSTLTGVTGGTAEVTTQLKATMQSFLSPSADMEKKLKSMGYASGAAALESEGLGGILGKLKEEVKGDEVAFANLFSSVEAKNAVLALTGAQAENFTEKTAAMTEATGAAEKAFDTQTSSVSAMMGKIKNAGQVMLTSVGEKFLPYINKALDKVIEHLPDLEAAFSSVADKVAPVIDIVISKASELWTQWQPVFQQIGTQFQTAITQMTPFFSQMLGSFDQIMPHIQPIVTTFTGVISSILPVVAPIFSGIQRVVAEVFPVVAGIIQDVGGKIQKVFSIIGEKTGFLQGVFESVAPAISEVLSTAWSIISPIVDLAIEGVGLIASAIEWAWPLISGIFEALWSVIGPIFEGIGKGIGWLADGVSSITGFFSGEGKEKPSGGEVGNNATGTSYWRGGYTMVGEHGAEMVSLPTGSKVHSNSQTTALAGSGSGGVNIHIDTMTVREEADIDKVATKLMEKIDETRKNM